MALIVFEGTEGVGKSTISAMLKDRLNAEIISSSHQDFLPAVREYVNRDVTKGVMARFIYYFGANRFSNNTVQRSKAKHQILDRYIYSTTVAHLAIDELFNRGACKEEIMDIFEKERGHMLAPDAIVFLYVDSETRRNRISSSTRSDKDALDTHDDFADRAQELFKDIAARVKGQCSVIEIDTSRLTKEQVAEKASDELRKIGIA